MGTFREFVRKRGVITAHNPMGNKLPDKENEDANRELLQFLRDRGYDPVPVRGSYNGHEEDAFEISDISLEDLTELGKRFDQKAIIWDDEEIEL